jgi:hypothetical protein
VATVFFSYSHKDEELRDQLEIHLSMLKRQGLIESWHDRRISVGDDFAGKISEEVERADIILLLVSPDFLASKYCYDVEMKRAMERHHAGQARVIPVILRHCDWFSAPFGKLLAAPKDAKPVRAWPDLDEAFLDVVRSIRAALPKAEKAVPETRKMPKPTELVMARPRSSNLRLKKEFTEADRDHFLEDAFSFIAHFFQNSLEELKARNKGIDFTFKRIDANQFTGVLYRDGKSISRCKVVLGGSFGKGIAYSHNDSTRDSAYNESLSVESDEQSLYLKALGMAHFGEQNKKHLTFEGAAEYYWALFIDRLQ